MRWNAAIGAIARCKRVSTGCGRKRRSAHAWRWTCGVKPKPKAVNKPSPHFIVHGLDKPGGFTTVSQEAFYSAKLGLVGGETIIDTLADRGALQEGTTPGRYAGGTLRFNETAFRLERKGNSPSDWKKLEWDDTHSGKVAVVPDGLKRGAVVSHYTIEARE